MAEAFKSSCEAELTHNERRSAHAGFWRGRAEVDRAAAAWIRWCHTARPHLALGGIAPRQAENPHATTRQEGRRLAPLPAEPRPRHVDGSGRGGCVVMEDSVGSCRRTAGTALFGPGRVRLAVGVDSGGRLTVVVRSWTGEDCIGAGKTVHWGRRRVIGVGNDALGQVINLPQCGLTCPNAANVPRCDSRRPGGRGARDGDRPSILAMRAWHNPDSSTALIAARSSILKGRRQPHPTPLNQENYLYPMAPPPGGRLPFESMTSLAQRPWSCPDRCTFQYKTPPRRDGRPYGRGSAPRSYSYPPGAMGWPPL